MMVQAKRIYMFIDDQSKDLFPFYHNDYSIF